MVPTADNGVTVVVRDKLDYADKALSLLAVTSTYRIINKDPTTKLKTKLTQMLRDIKQKGGFRDCSYRKVYPTSAVPPKFYGLPTIHKFDTPSDPLYSVRTPLHMGWQRSW